MIVQIATLAGAAQWPGTVPNDTLGRPMDFQPTVGVTRGENWAPVILDWNYNTNGTTAHQVFLDLSPIGATGNLVIPLYDSLATDATTFGTQFSQLGGVDGCITVPIFSQTPFRITLLTVGKAETSSLTLVWAWKQIG